jgi:ketosteroid isomerase-like protein
MSEENVEIVRELIARGEQARESGVTPLTDLVTPDAKINLSQRVFNPAVYRGYDGWAQLNDELQEVWAEWRVSCERIIGVDDRVVSIETVRRRGRGSGVHIEARYASIWTLLNGRVTRVEIGLDPNEAYKHLGLEE